MSLYTEQELIDFIKNIDLELNSGVTKSDLDTSQSKHSFAVSQRTLREQREYYLTLLKRVNPDRYRAIKGPSAIRFGGSNC